jgi:F-type H+/Na+-transporting ATPase subunit beta
MNRTTNIPVGDALLGRVIDASGAPLDERGPINAAQLPLDRPADADVTPLPDQLLETGIKVIDLFAPLIRGGTSTITAMPGVGLIVSSSELIQRIAARHGGCAVIADLEDGIYPISDLVADLRSGGIDQHVAIVVGRQGETPEGKRQIALAGLTVAEHFCEQGRETLLFLNEQLLTEQTVQRIRERRRNPDEGKGGSTRGSLTLLIWQIRTPETMNERALAQTLPVDGQIVFNRSLAKQNIWPAIDPALSTSCLLDGQVLGDEHTRVARAAQELLRDYGDLEGTGAAGDDLRLQARARRVLLFGSQPFVVAETFTARPGVYVPVAETVRGYSELVDGRHDDVPEEAFRFVGGIDQALGQAAG